MLIEFTVGNCLSFKEPVTLSMVSTSLKELRDTNTFSVIPKLSLLRSVVIYGANASGKSNLLHAMSFMRYFVSASSKETQIDDEIDVDGFLLSTETENEPSLFEIIFLLENVRYRYGFKVDKRKVHEEWLFALETIREAELFSRVGSEIKVGGKFKEGNKLEDKTRENALFLSVVAQFNGDISTRILKWFSTSFNVVSGLKDHQYGRFTLKKLDDVAFMKEVVNVLKVADVGIEDVKYETINACDDPLLEKAPEKFKKKLLEENAKRHEIFCLHGKYNEKRELVSSTSFEIEEESQGTRKLFYLSGAIFDTLREGKTLVIDEFDARLHPLLSRAIVDLFHSEESNPKNAQLIVATHDTTLLGKERYRRDQIYFIEKNRYGASDLYALSDYKMKIRNDASYAKDYVLGKYGAIPYLGDFKALFGGE